MKKALTSILLLALSACASQDDHYCHTQNLAPGSSAYTNCLTHYRQQEALFQRDNDACLADARQQVPDYMYESDHYEQTDIVDPRGVIHTQNILVEQGGGSRNNALDRQRMDIIHPCMLKRGWKEAGAGHWTPGIGNNYPVFP